MGLPFLNNPWASPYNNYYYSPYYYNSFGYPWNRWDGGTGNQVPCRKHYHLFIQ